MRASKTDRLARWTRGVGLMALAALAWAMFVPSGVFWTTALGAGLIASAVATAVLVRGPSFPSLAQAIASAEVEPTRATRRTGHKGGVVLPPPGERKP